MNDPSRAVFLSYASQEAESARRIDGGVQVLPERGHHIACVELTQRIRNRQFFVWPRQGALPTLQENRLGTGLSRSDDFF